VSAPADLRSRVQEAYNATGASWADGPIRIYSRLARVLVGRSPIALDGRVMVDAGAGTGALSRALTSAGATAIAVDVAVAMLAAGRSDPTDEGTGARCFLAAAAGDVGALPFATSSVDGAGAAFSLSHVPSPLSALRELARITRAGGVILLSSYGGPNPHPAKAAVDAAAAAHGFVPPTWHDELKHTTEPLVGSVDALRKLAADAGLRDVRIEQERVDVDMTDPIDLVRWRLGMPHLAGFLASCTAEQREAIAAAALATIGPRPEPYRPDVLFLTARAPTD
jgi:ubiquinone/menaquinone biosynthesis C-methylase UbiE